MEIAIPVVGTVAEAAALCPTADVFVNFASFRSAFDSTMEALVEPTIRTVAVIAEGVPEVGQRGGRGGWVGASSSEGGGALDKFWGGVGWGKAMGLVVGQVV